MPDDGPLSIKELSEYLGVPIDTIYKWNSEGSGPKRFRAGRHVLYRRADVEAWIETQIMLQEMKS